MAKHRHCTRFKKTTKGKHKGRRVCAKFAPGKSKKK